MEHTCNRLTNYCERILVKRGHPTGRKALFYFTLVYELEKFSDELKYICHFLLKQESKKRKVSKTTITYFGKCVEMFRSLQNHFYKFDVNKVNEIAKQRKGAVAEGVELLTVAKGTDAKVLHNVLIMIQLISNMNGVVLSIRF
jgi:hypothetical protein